MSRRLLGRLADEIDAGRRAGVHKTFTPIDGPIGGLDPSAS